MTVGCVFHIGPAVAPTHGSKGGVSHKIQQLLNTLKRPKKNRRPIEEYYQDEDGASEYCEFLLFLCDLCV